MYCQNIQYFILNSGFGNVFIKVPSWHQSTSQDTLLLQATWISWCAVKDQNYKTNTRINLSIRSKLLFKEINFTHQTSHKLCFNKVVIANQKKRSQPNFNVQLEIMLLQNCRNTVQTQQLSTRYTSQLICFKENKFEIFFIRFRFFH